MKPASLLRFLGSVLLLTLFSRPVLAQGPCAGNDGEPIKPIGNKIEFRSGQGESAPIGFSEFINPSSPPKKYLRKTISGQMMRGTWPQAGCPDNQYPATFSSSGSEWRLGYPYGPFTWSGSSLTPIADKGTMVTYNATPGTGSYGGVGLQLRLSLDDGHIAFYTPNNSGGGTTFDLPKGTTYSVWVWIFDGNNPSGTLGSISYITVGALPQTRDEWDIVREYTPATPSGIPFVTDTNASKRFSAFADFPMSGGGAEITPPVGWFKIDGPAYGGAGVEIGTTQTTRTLTGTGQCAPIEGGSEKYGGTVTETLSDEDTEQAAMVRAKSLADTAFANAEYSGIPVPAYETTLVGSQVIGIQRVEFRAKFDVKCAGEYDIYITVAEKPHNSAGPVRSRVVIERQPLESGIRTVKGEIKVENKDTDYTIQNIELHRPCGNQPPGGANLGVNSIHVGLSLGRGAAGTSAGEILLEAETPSSALYAPSALVPAAPVGSGVEIIRDGSGTLRQMKAPQALAEIEPLVAGSSYTVKFYAPSDAGAQDPVTRIYALSGTPFATYTFENPDTVGTTRLKITEVRGSLTRVSEYSYDSGTNTWTLSTGNGLRQESRVIATTGTDTTKTITISDGSTTVSKVAKTYRAYAWGEELIREVLDPDGAALTITCEFYTDELNDGGAYAHLKQRNHPDGSWERHTYDASGRALKTIRPFLDAVPTAAENLCRVTENIYSTLTDADGDSLPEELTTTIESTLGTETGRSYRVDWSKPVTLGTDVCTRRTDIRCVAAGAAWNAAANLVTETLTYTTAPFLGRTRRVINPDGTASLTAYAIAANGEQTAITKNGQPSGTLDDIIDGTRTTTFTSAQGQITGESVLDIASTLTLSSWTATQFDAVGRPTRLDHADGTYETRDYACCGLASSRDRSGAVTSYQYDALGRQTHVTRAGLTTRIAYDADGRVKSVTRIGTDDSEIIQESNIYDLAGRRTEHKDALNRVTGYSEVYDSGTGHTTRTTTNPDTGTSIEVSARDGSRLSVAGTAVPPRNYDYGIETGSLYTRETLVGPASATTEWIKTYTDFAGRTFKTVYADNATARSFYNPVGQLVKQVDPDGVTMLFGYNARGEQEVIAVDLDVDGVIDYDGTDRITRTVNNVAGKTVGATTCTVQRATTTVWETDALDAATTVSVSEQSADGLRSWQTVRGLTTTSVAVPDGSGGRAVTTTGPDGVKTVQVYSGDRLASTTVKTAADVQLAAVTYGYDPHGRQQTATDARNGVTTYAYFDDDQIHAVTTPDPDATRSGPGYDPQTTTYHYDNAGRVDTVTQPDGTVANTTYWPTGAVKRAWGSRTYPVEYTYDPQGRVKALTTWQDFAGDSGRAVTTWNYDGVRGWLNNKRYQDDTGPAYTYKPSGRLQNRIWARAGTLTTTYSYNAAGDLQGIDYSDSTPDVAMTYDRTGRPKTITDGSGSRTLAYEVSGQLKDEDYTAGLFNAIGVHRTFDSLARLGSVSVPSVYSVGYTYDAASRLDTVASGANTATYGYLTNSPLVESVTFKAGADTRLTSTKTYDNLNRLAAINSQVSGLSSQVSAAYTYNAANQRTKATREDSACWNYDYDALGQVTSGKKFDAANSVLLGHDFAWTYDDIGNRKTAAVNGATSTYTPTLLNTYAQRTVPGVIDVLGAAQTDATVTVTFPASGGTIFPTVRQGELYARQLTVDNGTAARYASVKVTGVKNLVGPNGEDAVTEETRSMLVTGTPEIFTHDADGNLTDDARWHYTWDGENRLIAMETGATAATAGVIRRKLEFAYDGQGRRFSKKVYSWTGSAWLLGSSTLFLYDGWNLLADLNALNSNSVVCTYVWGLDLSGSLQGAGGVGGLLAVSLSNGSTHAPCYDGNGNVIGLVDLLTGTRSATYEYNAFGETIVSDGPAAATNPFRFSTKYTDDESGLLYYGLRYYSPGTGRWLSRDPYEEEGGANLYGFVENAPTEWIDPLGLALYAFDGTNNNGYRDIKKNAETNVYILANVYKGNAWYIPGVGTNDGLLNLFGLAFGAGGQARESSMLAKAREFIQKGDTVADIIGFSRGAAQARDFANKLKGKYPCVKIRWMGLFDTVASEGLPNDVNIGYKLGIPEDTGSVLHITAGGERRKKTFALSSIRPGPGLPNANANYREEEMADAVHSDVGGGYRTNRGLANQALQRMWQDGINNSVPFGPLDARYSDTSGTPHDSRWRNDKLVELLTGKKRIRKIYYHP